MGPVPLYLHKVSSFYLQPFLKSLRLFGSILIGWMVSLKRCRFRLSTQPILCFRSPVCGISCPCFALVVYMNFIFRLRTEIFKSENKNCSEISILYIREIYFKQFTCHLLTRKQQNTLTDQNYK